MLAVLADALTGRHAVLRITIVVARALHHGRRQGIVHRVFELLLDPLKEGLRYGPIAARIRGGPPPTTLVS